MSPLENRIGKIQENRREKRGRFVKAGVRVAVKRVLRKNKVRAEDLDRFVEVIVEQAEALYRDWPRAA
jgi:hypothetical protein